MTAPARSSVTYHCERCDATLGTAGRNMAGAPVVHVGGGYVDHPTKLQCWRCGHRNLVTPGATPKPQADAAEAAHACRRAAEIIRPGP